jgi:hypothetical protein
MVNAFERLYAVQAGLAAIYGYDEKLPTHLYRDAERVGQKVPDTFLDACYYWAMDKVNLLSVVQRREQNAIYQVSLIELVGKEKFDAVSNRIYEFELNKSNFSNSELIRLRGISVSIASDELFRSTSIWVKPPSKPMYEREDGTSAAFDNIDGKIVRYGRVMAWNAIREPDVFGVVQLHNWSPIGKWSIGIDKVIPVHDVYIEFHVAMLAQGP